MCTHFAWYDHLNKFISSFSSCIKHTNAKTGPNWLNWIVSFLILQVLKVRKENKVTILELSSTFLPQANRNKLLQYILGFTLLWAKDLIPVLTPGSFLVKGFFWFLHNNPRCYSVESFTRKCLHVTATNYSLFAGRCFLFLFSSILWRSGNCAVDIPVFFFQEVSQTTNFFRNFARELMIF